MPIRAVLLDLFDTLVDLRFERLPEIEIGGRRYHAPYRRLYDDIVQRVPIEFEPFAEALVGVDREVRDEYYAQGRELPTRLRFLALLDRLGIDDDDLADSLTEAHMGLLRESAAFVDHHPEVMEELGRHVRLAVVSNFSHSPTALALLQQAGLRGHFEVIVISDEVGIRKPRPEIFQAALDRLGVSAEEAVHVGDSLHADVDGAARLGIRPAWLTRRVRDPDAALRDHEGEAPHWILEDLSELPGRVREGS